MSRRTGLRSYVARVWNALTSADQLEYMIRGYSTTRSGMHVTADTALACAAVNACVRVVSEDVAKLPLILYRRLPDGGKERATEHPLFRLLHSRPNAWQTSFEFREMMQGHLELRGNAYAMKVTSGRRVLELVPIHPDRVTVKQDTNFTLRYTVTPTGDEFTAGQILHLRGMSSDGFTGMSTLNHAREAVGLAKATERHGATMFGNGARPGGILSHPARLSPEAAKRLKEQWDDAHSGDNANGTAILEEGMSWAQMGMTSEDSQFLETRKFQRSEIASFFRIPPHMIGDLERATFSNIEHQGQEYVRGSLDPRLQRWTQRLNADLLTPAEQEEYFFEFLTDALLRGDTKARYDAYSTAITNGFMSRNEARVRENLNPAPGLDEFLQPLNMGTATATPEAAA
jgi:HK97 family phage portal protein